MLRKGVVEHPPTATTTRHRLGLLLVRVLDSRRSHQPYATRRRPCSPLPGRPLSPLYALESIQTPDSTMIASCRSRKSHTLLGLERAGSTQVIRVSAQVRNLKARLLEIPPVLSIVHHCVSRSTRPFSYDAHRVCHTSVSSAPTHKLLDLLCGHGFDLPLFQPS